MDGLTALLYLVIIAAVCLVVYLFYRSYNTPGAMFKKKAPAAPNGEVPGLHGGADTLARLLRRHAGDYKVFAPATVSAGGRTAQLEGILVGYFGVLCLRGLQCYGTIYGTAQDAHWVNVRESARAEFDNPVLEAAADARVVREALFAAGLKGIPVESAAVFVGRGAELAMPVSAGYYTEASLAAYLKSSHFDRDKKVDVEKAAAAIQAAMQV